MRNMTPRTYIRIVLVAHLSFFRLQQRQPRTDGNHMCSRDGDVAPDVRHGVAAVGLDSGLARPADAGRVPRAGRRRLAQAPARRPPGPPLLRRPAASQEMVII